ncbi:MAG TPA: hypothetical protein ENH03_02195, partial [Candidatus Bathyarchaeota archaeon]|nr:hypothetical protein [Candidatus Bathyarchaeota archaeon]
VKVFYYEGDLIKIRPTSTGHFILATPNHPFLAVKRVKAGSRGGTKTISRLKQITIQKQSMEWIPAEELSVSDYLLTPIINDVDVEAINISDFIDVPIVNDEICYPQSPFSKKRITRPNRIPINRSFLTFCGFYVAEGHAEKRSIVFTFGKHEERYVEEILKIGKEIFGVTGRIYQYSKKIVVYFNAWYLPKLFKLWFGSSATTKKIPLWIKKLPAGKLVYFLEAYMRGDGCKITIHRRRRYTVSQISTASKTLAFDIFQIMLKIGIVPSISVEKQAGFKKESLIYRLGISSNGLERFMRSLGVNESTGIVQRRSQSFVNQRYAWLRIRSIERVHFKGYVYNLEVEESSSFVTELIAVHNSMHARYTPAEVFYYGAKPDPNLTEGVPDIVKYRVEDPLRHDVINIIEDRRIEDMGVEMWPGYKHERLFSNAYFWSQRMDVGEFFERYLSHFYDDKTGKYDISSMIPPGSNSKVRRAYREYLNRRIARMRHEAFLQRLITGKIKGADKLPLKERQLIENVAAEVEDALKPIEKENASKAKVVETLVNLTEKVIKKLKLKYYKPPIRRLGDSSWNQTFEEPMETDPKEVKAGIDDYFDEIIEVEYICTKCGRPYSRRYGHRIKPGGGAPPPGVNVRGRT